MSHRNHQDALEYDRRRRREHPDIARNYYLANRERILERHRRYYQTHKDAIQKQRKNYNKLNSEKCNASSLARFHIPLKNSCEECGSKENLVRHHPDYSKPLEVVTLCSTCHSQLHLGLKDKVNVVVNPKRGTVVYDDLGRAWYICRGCGRRIPHWGHVPMKGSCRWCGVSKGEA